MEMGVGKRRPGVAGSPGARKFLNMRQILPGIFRWGSTYADRPWELNGYAIQLGAGTALIDPPAPENDDWAGFDALTPILKIVVTNRDHLRDAALFRTRYGAPLLAGANEVAQLAPVAIDETVREGDRIAGALLVIDLPGKSPGEIGLFMDRPINATAIGHPPGSLGLIPEHKLDNRALLKQSLRKLLNLDFDVLLLCDGEPVTSDAKSRVVEFVGNLV